MAKRKQKFASTQAAAAKAIGISRYTFVELARDPDFPKKSAKGYDIEACRSFCEKHGRGQYRKGSGGESTSVGGVTLTEAKIKDTIEHAENERIKKERQIVEQARELGQILLLEDVQADVAKIIATVTECASALSTAIDRALPERPPSAKVWGEIRTKAIALADKLPRDIGAAVSELW